LLRDGITSALSAAELAEQVPGSSGAEIEELCRQANCMRAREVYAEIKHLEEQGLNEAARISEIQSGGVSIFPWLRTFLTSY